MACTATGRASLPPNIDRNALRVTVDYRSVLADILEHRLATGNMGAVLPGYEDTPEQASQPRRCPSASTV